MKKRLTWKDVLAVEKQKPYFINIINIISNERQNGNRIYPPQRDIFNAFRYTQLGAIKAVILGQDPYPGLGEAHGLAFSVRVGIKIPPSLLNIYKELENTVSGFTNPHHGYLGSWARQGVFLLNSILTVRAGQAHSHAHLGWEVFTDKVIKLINEHCEKVVFLLWGAHAKKKGLIINQERHYVLTAPHPSPLSARLGFFGCNHFNLANKWLEKQNKKPINWVLPSNFIRDSIRKAR